MTNKLTKNNQVHWGDDIFALASKRLPAEGGLVADAEKAVIVHYRMELRTRFQIDPKVKEALRPGVPVRECFEDIHTAVADVCREGTEQLFLQVLHELVDELEGLQKSGAALVLVDNSTGKTIMPIQEKHIYTPPDFIDESGQKRKARPILHPSISGPLTLVEHEKGKKSALLAKMTPQNHLSFTHITDPDGIARAALEILKKNGIEVCAVENGQKESVEIGREQIQGMEQSPNFKFHRAHMFGSLLAHHILKIMQRKGKCDEHIQVTLQRNSKFRWYKAEFTYSV